MLFYHNIKTGKYIPALWYVTEKKNKLEYFVRGKGYIEVPLKDFNKIEVDIKKPANYYESWLIYSKYGKETLKQVITNNAECWKDSYCFIVSGGEKACKLYDQFALYFNADILGFVDYKLQFFGMFLFDIIKFETYVFRQFGYDPSALISLSEFIHITFGQDQVDCINNLIDFYDYIKEA